MVKPRVVFDCMIFLQAAAKPLGPTAALQQAIVTLIHSMATQTQRLERLYQQKQAALGAMKKSLLHQAFTGQL